VRKGLASTARRLRLAYTLKTTKPRRKEGRFLVYRLKVMGLDHPGIVHRVSGLLAQLGVNVASLDTRLSEAPVSGAPVFVMAADIQVPLETTGIEIRRALDEVCSQEALDFSLDVVS
jgi:glycine cleavage system transcriptional repressor